MLNLLAGQNFRDKMVPVFQFVCQHHYLSSWVSLLIKMNGRLMTGVVSFNVTFVFIFHPNIPLSEDSRVYKPSLQSSRVTITTVNPNHSLADFLTFSFCRSLYLSISLCFTLPLLSYNLCFASITKRQIDTIALGADYVTRESFSTLPLLLLLVANTHRAIYHISGYMRPF